MGLFDVITVEIQGRKLDFQTKWRLIVKKGKLATKCIETIKIENVADKTDALVFLDGYIALDVSENAELPSYDDCILHRYKIGDEVLPGVKIGDVLSIEISSIRFEIAKRVKTTTKHKNGIEVSSRSFKDEDRSIVFVEFAKPIEYTEENLRSAIRTALDSFDVT